MTLSVVCYNTAYIVLGGKGFAKLSHGINHFSLMSKDHEVKGKQGGREQHSKLPENSNTCKKPKNPKSLHRQVNRLGPPPSIDG